MRRSTGQPRPFQRKDGRWSVAVQVGRGSREHRARRYLYGSSRDEVLAKLAEHDRRARIGLGPVDERLTMATYLNAWAEGLTGRRPRTVESYRATVDKHLVKRIGHVSLLAIRAADIRRMVRDLEREIGTRTASYALTILRMALEVAVKDRILERNEAKFVDAPRSGKLDRVLLNEAQTRRLLDQVRSDRLEAFYVLAITTGMRRGELLALGWDDVDLEARTVRVTRTLLYRPGDAYELVPPKTAKSRRPLRLSVMAATALRERKRQQNDERLAAGTEWSKTWAKGKLVFTTVKGGALAGTTVGHALHRHLRDAGLPPQRVHDLRHLHGTTLHEHGFDLRRVADQLGHSSIGVTSDIYVHTAPAAWEPAELMDRLFGDAVDVRVDVNGRSDA